MTGNTFGTVEFEGKGYILTQEAYITGTHESPRYEAHAIDNEANEYMVTWLPVENWRELEDASDHCDWNSPAAVVEC